MKTLIIKYCWHLITVLAFLAIGLTIYDFVSLPDTWQQYSYPEYFVEIKFPHKPAITNRGSQIETHLDTNVVFQSTDSAKNLYQLSVAKYTNNLPDADRINGATTAILAQFLPDSVSTTSTKSGQHDGIELGGKLKDTNHTVHGRVFAINQNAYLLYVICNKECDPSMFFNSFNLSF